MKLTLKLLVAAIVATGQGAALASQPLSPALRAEMIANAEQVCQVQSYMDFIASEPSLNSQLPAQFRDQARFPLVGFRQRMQSEPQTAKLDRRIEQGCRCIMKPFHDGISAARTLDDVSAFNKRMNERSRTPNPADSKRIDMCWARARADNK